ncbi:hypothetical protein F4781DRAFT_438953 [Annulohypoxylon bovei var. microspora]|nr:hypothetical protein F4781DRAFT_438953 [Annulohypoxylon bovei var. microspora]
MSHFTRLLPRAGMIYPKGGPFTRQQRDEQIFSALKRHGIINTSRGASKKENIEAIDQAFADMFVVALQPKIIQCKEGWGGAIAVIMTLQHHIPWAKKLSDVGFIHLCCVLVKSRNDWHKNPRFPLDVNKHRATAQKIDAFLEVVGDDDWWENAKIFFDLPEEDGDEEEEEEDQENTVGPVASSSSSLSPSHDTDIDMSDVATALDEDLSEKEAMDGAQPMDLDK